MDRRQLACAAAAAIVGSLLLTSTASLAQPPVVVTKQVSPLTQRVPFYDLSLATKEGRNTLIHRVGYAVNQVCPDYDEEASPYDVSGCKDFAWTGAWRQMRPLFKQARMGQAPLIATIEIVAAK